MKYYNTK